MPADLPSWHVLGDQIRKTTTLMPNSNTIGTVYEVTYQVDSGPAKGTRHDLAIPERDFTEAQVKSLIETDLNNVHRVAGLSSDHA